MATEQRDEPGRCRSTCRPAPGSLATWRQSIPGLLPSTAAVTTIGLHNQSQTCFTRAASHHQRAPNGYRGQPLGAQPGRGGRSITSCAAPARQPALMMSATAMTIVARSGFARAGCSVATQLLGHKLVLSRAFGRVSRRRRRSHGNGLEKPPDNTSLPTFSAVSPRRHSTHPKFPQGACRSGLSFS